MALSRRSFMVSAFAAGAVFGFARPAAAGGGVQPSAQLAAAPNAFEPTVWFRIDRDGLVRVNIAKAEMGQHIGTALAPILADELAADWDSVRLFGVDTDPKWGPMVTGASNSVWQTYPVFSRAGAAGRRCSVWRPANAPPARAASRRAAARSATGTSCSAATWRAASAQTS